ncbi:M56 family metallopeptidase [Desulfosporosinus sp. FKA]|uniref:M56 family metallopeptidase n=1 Tax=Desulfosporosinus sp. FKA TaxID=1969834 RepID=UPI000B49E802|nr:M56 family metallopeptidase [Desulfosporosinus sp. FKA]
MNDTIKLILSLSLSGSILAVLLFAAKPFIKNRLSKSIQYYVWLVVLVRLLFPFSFEGSLMNYVFNSQTVPVTISSQNAVKPVSGVSGNNASSAIPTKVEKNVAEGVYDNDTDHNRYLKDLLNQYSLDLWLLGVLIVIAANSIGYARFLNYLRKSNTPASDEQKEQLNTLLNGRLKVKLVRNHFVTTPMLIGILRPCIIIPDSDYTRVQLKNILLHEISHLKRFDVAIKWLAMLAAAIHWFNPLMYFIRREINHACELACDEAVIKNLTPAEKQVYGDTLIAVAAEHRYPLGVMQVTMSEEKKSLKERLLAIMNHNKKSRFIITISVLLLAAAVLGAAILGASVRPVGDKPPRIYINAEDDKTKEALSGSYTWKYLNTTINADADDPVNFKYGPDNIVNVAAGRQLIIGTQKIKLDKEYDFTIKQISVYKDSKPVKFETAKPSFLGKNLYLQAPLDAGEYTYCLILDFKDRGTVSYGFVANVVLYDLTGIAKYRTPYVGNNSKVLALTSLLPVPDHSFKQQYISLQTEAHPYGLTVYYEAVPNKQYQGEWPIDITKSSMKSALEKNALVLFCMIDNAEKVTFAFRNTPSEGDLDTAKYGSSITFLRADIAKKYGDLSALGKNLDSLYKIIGNKPVLTN